jgi:hypothetical protein
VNVTVPPGTSNGDDEVLEIVTCGWTGTSTLDEHSGAGGAAPGGQFVPGEVTDAALATPPSAVTAVAGNGSAAWVFTVSVTDVPAGKRATVQVTVTVSADVQPSGDDRKVSPVGSTSVTTTADAGAAESFVTVIV